MYTKDKSCRITLRLNPQQFEFVKANADMMDCSPSDFLRMVVNVAMVNRKNVNNKLSQVLQAKKIEMEGLGRENDKADFDDKL